MTPPREQALLERIAHLEEVLGLQLKFPIEWGLSKHQTTILQLLARRDMSIEGIMEALYWDVADPPMMETVRVQISKMRRILKPFHIEIITAWGVGYGLTAESRARLLAILAGRDE